MKKNILIAIIAFGFCSNAFATSDRFKSMAYKLGIVVVNKARSYKLSISGLFNDITKLDEAGTSNDYSWIPLNPATKKFTISAIDKNNKVVAKQTFTRGANEDVFLINVSSLGGLSKAEVTADIYAAEVARGKKEFNSYDL
jgi:hypothetical protein